MVFLIRLAQSLISWYTIALSDKMSHFVFQLSEVLFQVFIYLSHV